MKRFKTCIQPFLIAVLLTATAASAQAHESEEHKSAAPHEDVTAQSKVADEALTRQIWFKPKLQEQIPLETTFQDETGKTVPLRQYFGQKPVVLVLIYYRCATMCIAVLETLESSLQELRWTVGQEFDIVAVSIDPRETPDDAVAIKQQYVQRYGRPGAEQGWHFLTGQKNSIQSLAKSVGFGYAYNTKTGEYAHPNGILVLTPQGTISHSFPDLSYSTQDLRLSLVQASPSALSSLGDKTLLLGLDSNPTTGEYQINVRKAAGMTASLAVLLLALGLAAVTHRRRCNPRRGAQVSPAVGQEQEIRGESP